jgi:hydroxyacylglutathione hydrolase
LIIDPLRDVDIYMKLANERQTEIKYIIETHFHADFVSGHLELAKKGEALIVYGDEAETKFPINKVKEDDRLELGQIQLKALHTPGHTYESMSYLLLDPKEEPYCVFTGDALFLGEVGRPDLAVSK